MAGSCEYGDESSGSGATDLISLPFSAKRSVKGFRLHRLRTYLFPVRVTCPAYLTLFVLMGTRGLFPGVKRG
jgi:hypothetical protein